MTNLEEQVRQGERARALLEDPLVVSAFERLEQDCLDRWRSSAPGGADERERLFVTIGVIDRLRQDFASLVTTGRLARLELEERRKAAAADPHR